MQCYQVIEITNREPLKIGAAGSKANQTEPSKDYIPGSSLRGAVIAAMTSQGMFAGNEKNVLLSMACGNAYPYRNGSLYLPAPRHLRMDKHDWRKRKSLCHINNQDVVPYITLTDLLTTREQAKNNLEYHFLTIRDNHLAGLQVAREYRLHHSTSRNADRAEKENLFRYQAISSGQTFRALIWFDASLQSLIERIFQQQSPVYLGGSKGSGYGLCDWQPVGNVVTEYQEVKRRIGLPERLRREFAGEEPGTELRITCLSDILVRNQYGQPVNVIPEDKLAAICGQPVKFKDQSIETGLTEGYNSTWQARYPKETTLKAGSVLRYTFQTPQSEENLQKIADEIERTLLGDRIQDGFGWLGVNLPYPQRLLIAETENAIEETAYAADDLAQLRKAPRVRDVLSRIISGLETAKMKWLNMICVRSWESGQKLPGADCFILSELNKSQLATLRTQLKTAQAGNWEQKRYLSRGYQENNCQCSIAQCNFVQILAFLTHKEGTLPYPELTAYARKRLRSRSAQLFYSQDRQPEKTFIGDLLLAGIEIKLSRGKGGTTYEANNPV